MNKATYRKRCVVVRDARMRMAVPADSSAIAAPRWAGTPQGGVHVRDRDSPRKRHCLGNRHGGSVFDVRIQ